MKQLIHLKYCIKESLRLFPPVSVVGRVLDQDTNITGHTMPKGMSVTCCIYTIHWHPHFWENPDVIIVNYNHQRRRIILLLTFPVYRSLILFDLLLRTPKVVILTPLFPSLLDLGQPATCMIAQFLTLPTYLHFNFCLQELHWSGVCYE